MVGRVLAKRGVIARSGKEFELLDFPSFTPDQKRQLLDACQRKLEEYVEKRGEAIWAHRRLSSGYVSGTIRYEVLKAAKFRCELCAISGEERALEVDHIIPRNKGGSDDITNFQALCYSCNAMKQDRDDTDFRKVRAAYAERDENCPFCSFSDNKVVLKNELAIVVRDIYAVSDGHLLVIPRRHTADYFTLGTAEIQACHRLLSEARAQALESDPKIAGFNVGINCGETAGQTVMHCHIHLIPRRIGDNPNPRGGVRCVIPGKADYTAKK